MSDKKLDSVYQCVGYCKQENTLLFELDRNHPSLCPKFAEKMSKFFKIPMGEFLKRQLK